MKKLLFTVLVLLVCFAASADDVIVLRSSKRISANILEVGKTEVRYKEASNPNGPTFVLDTDDILSVIYSSGTVQNFEQRPKEVSEWEYEEMQEAQRKQALKDRKDSIAQAKLLKKEEKHKLWASYPWTNMIFANGSISFEKSFGFGITYARVKQFGFYVSAQSGTNFRFKADEVYDDDYYEYYVKDYCKTEITMFSGTAGAMFRLKVPLYFYLGAGYGYLGRYNIEEYYDYDDNGNRIRIPEFTRISQTMRQNFDKHGISTECGLIGNIKGFGLSCGIQVVQPIFFSHRPLIQCKIGIGYCF